MTNNNNGEKSNDFSPDLAVLQDNLKGKRLSININKDNSTTLEQLQERGIDVNDFVNKVLSEHLRLEKSIPKDVKGLKTSINFDGTTTMKLKKLKENSINVSNYVNKVISDHFKLEKQLEKDVYKKCIGDFVKVEIVVHKDLALLLKWLELNKGSIPLANKLVEVIANDSIHQGQLLRGDCSVYGVNTLETALNTIRRAFDKLE